MLNSRRVVLIGLSIIGCTPGEFAGSDKQIRFSTNLGRTVRGFTPSAGGIAVGTPVEIHAVDIVNRDPDGGSAAPQAEVTVEDPTFFSALDAGVDSLFGVVTHAGSTTLHWKGKRVDSFTLRSGVPTLAQLEDPFLFQGPSFPLTLGEAWPSPGEEVVLVEGSPLFLEVLLRDADGGWLAHGPDAVAVSNDGGGFSVSTQRLGVLLLAEDAGTPASRTSTLSYGGQTLGSFELRRGFERDVVSVDIAANDQIVRGYVFLKATARLDGGQTLWQAPVKWTYDPRLQPFALLEELQISPPRPDILVLVWMNDAGYAGNDAGLFETEISAQIGPASSSLAVKIDVGFEEPFDAGEADDPYTDKTFNTADAGTTLGAPVIPACGCSSASPANVAVWLAALALMVTKARRRSEHLPTRKLTLTSKVQNRR